MTFLTLLQGAPQQNPGGGAYMWIMLILMFVIMYFFMIRPQNKKQKELNNFRKSLEINQSVVTAGGIHGTVKAIDTDTVTVEIANNVKIVVEKASIYKSLDQQPAK